MVQQFIVKQISHLNPSCKFYIEVFFKKENKIHKENVNIKPFNIIISVATVTSDSCI